MRRTKPKFKNVREARRFARYLVHQKGARERIVEVPVEGQIGPGLSLPATSAGRSIHIHLVSQGRRVIAQAHSEPDTLTNPVDHTTALLTGTGIDYAAGLRSLQGHFRDFQLATCRRCGRTIWSKESLRTGLGSYCRTLA